MRETGAGGESGGKGRGGEGREAGPRPGERPIGATEEGAGAPAPSPGEDRSSIPPDAAEVLEFWFGELGPGDWFRKDPELDARIRARFEPLCLRLAREGVPAAWKATPRGALAAIVALDQLPRNMYRDDPRAFATDPEALAIARDAVARGFDRDLSPEERKFLWMPFQHSEDPEMQARSVELFRGLGDERSLRFALRHQEIVLRFGRFPHRNAILGRLSSPEELEFLKEPGSSF